MGSSQHTNLVLFDGVCNLCNGFVQFLIRHDRKNLFSFGSLQSERVQRLMAEHPASPDKSAHGNSLTSVIYVRHGQYYTRSTAVLHILTDLGGLWRVTGICRIIPRQIRDMIYNWISRRRYRWWGQRQTCIIPGLELKKRFID